MYELVTNRFNQSTPTIVLEDGTAISTPTYINLSNDAAKALLNAFREVVLKQQLEMGHKPTDLSTRGGLEVVNHTKPPKTPAELELGMDVENLRYVLFGRTGSPERVVLKLQELTGMSIVSSDQVKMVQDKWRNHVFSYESKTATKPRKTRSASKGRATKEKDSKATSSVSSEID